MRIDEHLIAQYRLLHAATPRYGMGGDHHYHAIKTYAQHIDAKTMLDYGCGKGSLVRLLECQGYDPAVDEFANEPHGADLVFSTDFLEHTTRETIDAVIAHIYLMAMRGTWHCVHTGRAHFHLPDGTNCHTLQRAPQWWEDTFGEWFKQVRVIEVDEMHCIITGVV